MTKRQFEHGIVYESVNAKEMETNMCSYFRRDVGVRNTKCLFAAILLVVLLALGPGSIASASETHSLLQFKNDRVTGVLRHIPLRDVLEQFHNELAIEYIAPGKELDKHLSTDIVEESVSEALSKILAPWDYALQVDQQGRIQQVFVVAKTMKQNEVEEDGHKISQEEPLLAPVLKNMEESEHIPRKFNRMTALGAEVSSNSSGIVPKNYWQSTEALPYVEDTGIHSIDLLHPHGNPMIIRPSSNAMEVIPASSYPPMEILPVSEELQREFLEEF